MAAGIGVTEFWDLTPGETVALVRARLRRERERDLWLAWHIAALGRVKKFPSLKRLLRPAKAHGLTPDQAAQRQAEFEELKARMERPVRRDEHTTDKTGG